MRRLGVVMAALASIVVLTLTAGLPAGASDDVLGDGLPEPDKKNSGESGGNGKTDTSESSSPSPSSTGTTTEQLDTSDSSCSVYGNASGMGMNCVSPGSGNSKSLRERFGGQKLQKCRYGDVPKSLEPSKAEKDRHSGDDGQFMLMSCLNNIDYDTYTGGPDRTVDVSVVWVDEGTDVADKHNGISEFLWDQADSEAQMPVPFLESKPNPVPVVGAQTFFTFKWLDPVSKDVTAEGPYADRDGGGPFKKITEGDVQMEAKAAKIRIDPNQEDMDAITCAADTPYRNGKSDKEQPDDACSMRFDRTSATAEEFATEDIPSNVDEAFYLTIEVDWKIRYGEKGSDLRSLGDAFTMKMHQQLPVQEVQALNQPPFSIY